MATRRIVHEERFSIPAIAASGTYYVPLDENKKKFHPMNHWELHNASGVSLGANKNQDTEKKIEVKDGQGAREVFEDGVSFTSFSLTNENAVTASTVDKAILILRRIEEVD